MSKKTYSISADGLLKQIISRCYEISTQTVADVFFSYSPHTSEINVRYYPKGWSAGTEEFIYLYHINDSSIYFGGEKGIEPLENILEQLNDLYSKYMNVDKAVIEE